MDPSLQPRKTHQMEFVSDALASLFHNSPGEYLTFLNRDGTKFLRFYWDKVGEKIEGARRVDSYGLNYEFRTPEKNTTVVLVTLPRPLVDGESFFAAQVYRPLRRTPFLGISDITRMFTLDRDDESPSGTYLREWSRRFRLVEIGPGPAPELDAFYEAVMAYLASE